MIHSFFSSEGRIGRAAFIIRIVVLTAIVVGVFFVSDAFFDKGMKAFYKGWHAGTFGSLAVFMTIVFGLIAAMIGMMQLIKRLHDMGKPPYLTLLMLVPGVNILFLLYTFVAPAKAESLR